ncbi:8226_t:CDS:2, partial [Gigaspora rosea]
MLPLCNLHSRTIEEVKLANTIRKQRFRRTQASMNRPSKTYKIALNFCETAMTVHCVLESPCICSYCHAKLFSGETGGIPETVAYLKDLYTSCDDMGIRFRNNIHAYNSVFAFTSMGVKLDEKLANGKNGVYTFRVQGGIYHAIGFLYPDNEIPKFLQLYIYDTKHETNNRLAIMPKLRKDTLEMIKM